ncbi:MAG TPA: glutathione transferase [Kofleriaceae bacterium]|jgi:glutathione S-transferase
MALTLYAESSWTSPWVLHAMVALEEKKLPYKLEVVPYPIPAAQKAQLAQKALRGKVPILVDGERWIGESEAISEYLAEQYPFPTHPRLFPADLGDRARARQLMLYVRTALQALRTERPTTSVFYRPVSEPLTPAGAADAEELIAVASAAVKPGATNLFAEWCIADPDLAVALMRLVANHHPMPEHLVAYAHAQWDRRSVKKFIAHLPTTR